MDEITKDCKKFFYDRDFYVAVDWEKVSSANEKGINWYIGEVLLKMFREKLVLAYAQKPLDLKADKDKIKKMFNAAERYYATAYDPHRGLCFPAKGGIITRYHYMQAKSIFHESILDWYGCLANKTNADLYYYEEYTNVILMDAIKSCEEIIETKNKEKSLSHKKNELQNKENQLKSKENELKTKENELINKENELKNKENELKNKENELSR